MSCRGLPDTVGVWAVLALALGTAACAQVRQPVSHLSRTTAAAWIRRRRRGPTPHRHRHRRQTGNDIPHLGGGTAPSITCNPPGTLRGDQRRLPAPLDCSASCAANEICDQNICVGDSNCVALTCAVTNGAVLRHRGQRLRPRHGLRHLRRAWFARRACAFPAPACAAHHDGHGRTAARSATAVAGPSSARTVPRARPAVARASRTPARPPTARRRPARRRAAPATAGRSVTAAGGRSIAAPAPEPRSARRTSAGRRAACR